MGDCHIFYDEIRISLRQPDLTETWVYIRGEGDCPFQCVGWRYKAFPRLVTAADVMTMWQNGDESPLDWPRMDPPPTVLNYTPDWDAIEADIVARLGERGEKLSDE